MGAKREKRKQKRKEEAAGHVGEWASAHRSVYEQLASLPEIGPPIFPEAWSAGEVTRGNARQLKRAYHRAAAKLHPDKLVDLPVSAQALAETLRLQHGDSIETSIVDVWTDYGPYPWGKNMVPYYRGLAKRPALWHAHFRASAFTPTCYLMSRLMSTVAYKGFETCIREHAPDVVVSMHPLCQAAPIKVLRTMHKAELETALDTLQRPARVADRLIRRRLEVFISPVATRVIAAASLCVALVMPVLELIPFSANLAGVALFAFGISLIARDGLFALISLVVSPVALGLVGWWLIGQ